MKTSEIKEALLFAKQNFNSVADNLNNYLRSEVGMVVNELPAGFGCKRWLIKRPDKRMYIYLYSTGEVVFDCLTKLTDSEKTTLDTSEDFISPNMEPRPGNYLDITTLTVGIETLILKIKEHFATTVST